MKIEMSRLALSLREGGYFERSEMEPGEGCDKTRGDPPHPPSASLSTLSRKGRGEKSYAALASVDLVSAKAQSIHCVSSATSLASTVAPHQMRRPAGASR